MGACGPVNLRFFLTETYPRVGWLPICTFYSSDLVVYTSLLEGRVDLGIEEIY